MSSGKLSKTTMLVFGFVIVFLLGSISAATAGATFNGKNIKKGSIPLSALSGSAQKALAGAPGPVGAPGAPGAPGASAARYWAYVTDTGTIGRSSAGVTSSYNTNGNANKIYTVRFPVDVSQCGYSVTTGDTDPIGASGAVDGFVAGVTRSTLDSNTVAVSLWLRNTPNGNFANANLGQSNFYIAVFC